MQPSRDMCCRSVVQGKTASWCARASDVVCIKVDPGHFAPALPGCRQGPVEVVASCASAAQIMLMHCCLHAGGMQAWTLKGSKYATISMYSQSLAAE